MPAICRRCLLQILQEPLNAYEERGENYLKQQAGAGIQKLFIKIRRFEIINLLD